MSARLLCCVALCLLGTGSFDAKVVQSPRHLVKEKGQKANMDCFPEKGHTAFYWYHQSQKEFKLLINFRNEEIMEQTDMAKKRFSAKCPSNSPCSLEIQSSEAGDSGLYFCASSQYTALQCHHGYKAPLLHSPLSPGSRPFECQSHPDSKISGQRKEQKAKMSCSPEKGHPVVFWYKQNNNNEFTFLISFQNQEVLQQIDMIKN
ncbi:T-cell receptor beta chain V region 3H.25 [Microtus ochrogaster]|nr:T-cell receptor beta chain V region 3H.25 [Microtus ochrogaster]